MTSDHVPLGEYAIAVKSANAGASWITFDVRFENMASFQWIQHSGILDEELFARLYKVEPDDVQIFPYEPALTIKVTIPRRGVTGGVDETDFDGVQQFAPLLDVLVPVPPTLQSDRTGPDS